MASLRQSQKTYYFGLCHNVFTLRKATVPGYMESINFFIKTEIVEENTPLLFKRGWYAGWQSFKHDKYINITSQHMQDFQYTCTNRKKYIRPNEFSLFMDFHQLEENLLVLDQLFKSSKFIFGPVTRKLMFINSFCFE